MQLNAKEHVRFQDSYATILKVWLHLMLNFVAISVWHTEHVVDGLPHFL